MKQKTYSLWRTALPVMAAAALLCPVGCRKQAEPDRVPGELTALLQLSTNVIRIGDLVTAQLVVNHPAGGDIQLPGLEASSRLAMGALR